MQYLILPAGDSSFNVTTQDVTVFEGPEIVLQTEENDHTSQIRAKRQNLDHLSNYEKLSRRSVLYDVHCTLQKQTQNLLFLI